MKGSAIRVPGIILVLVFLLFSFNPIFAETGASTGDGGTAAGEGSSAGSGAPIIEAPSPADIFGPEAEDSSPSGGIEILDLTGNGQEEGAMPSGPSVEDDIKDYISGSTPSVITDKLPRFGYSFFSRPPTTFAPMQDVPVGPDYVVGPGDTIRIDIWGLEEGHYTVPVDRSGTLALPRAGAIGVAGLSFEQVQEAITNAYSRFFNNFEINITMGRLRSIQVYAVGQVNRPGTYTISSLSTLMNALIACGGPSYSGTLRNIQVKRNDRVVATFDAYEFLLQGNMKNDLRLMNGDVIFVPPVGSIVGITGDIKNPAYYELKGQARLADLVEMAGGFTNRYFKGRVQVDRTMGNEYRTSFESDLDGLRKDMGKNIPLENGDLVKVYSVMIQESKVYLSGAVARPGQYSITLKSTRVSDVIRRAGGLLYMAAEQGELTRVHVTQEGPQTERFRFSIPSALRGDPNHDILLDVNDYITVRTVPEWNLYSTVRINGEVRYPGVYTIRKGERLSDLIELAGGYTDEAFLAGSTFSRASVRTKQQERIKDMIDRLEKQLYGASVEGTATALTETDARMTAIETEQRQKFLDRLRQTKATGRIVVKLPENPRLLKGTPYDMELEQGDTLFIPKKPQTVQVLGAVYNPMAFIYRPEQPFTYYVDQAGGYSFNADKKRVYVIKADGTATRAFVNNRAVLLQDGDSVIVPEKIDVKGNLRDTRDIVDILYKIAVSAAVLID